MLKIVGILANLRREISEIGPGQGAFLAYLAWLYRYLDISLIKRDKIDIVVSRFCWYGLT
jgi:SAM-dependent MidA family methyltransferase